MGIEDTQNDNENIMYQNLWYAAKTAHQEKFTA